MNIRSFIDIILLALMWGPSFAFMKIVIVEIPPLTLVGLRVSIAALILALICAMRRITLPNDSSLWVKLAIVGFFSCGFPFLSFTYAIGHVKSLIPSAIVGFVPMATCVLAHYFVPNETLNKQKIIGVLLGLSGFSLLFIPTILDGEVSGDTWGMLASFCAACSYAVGMVLARRLVPTNLGIVAPTMQLLVAGTAILLAAFIFESPMQLAMPSVKAWGFLLILAVWGTTFAYWIYFRIVSRDGAVAVSMVGYLLPVVGIITGALLLGETISKTFIIATALILTGMLIVNRNNKAKSPVCERAQ